LRYFCSPQHTDSALYPFISQMERAAGFASDDTAQAKLDKLDALLAKSFTPGQDAALLAEMLSLPNDGRYPTFELAPQQRRQKTLEALATQLEALSRANPVLIIFEDLHWIDPTSLEVAGRLVDRLRTLGALLILTFRPEFEPPWLGRAYVTAVNLNRLAEREIAALIVRITGDKSSLPQRVTLDIIERTDGIPLFVEEMTRAVLEAASEGDVERAITTVPSTALAIPASLHASLMARLDRLGPAKELAQVGAAIGREFSHALLVAVAGKPERELNSALDRLVVAGLLFRQGVAPQATYLFKHALVQDASYGTLLREPRRVLHARIAAALETDASVAPETMAYHLAQAGDLDLAASFWFTAGKRCAKRSANVEAITHLTRGISGLQSMPETPERARLELDFQLAIGPALLGIWNASDAERAYRRALALCEVIGEHRRRFDVVWGLWLTSVHVQRDFGRAAEHVAELFRIAQQLDDPDLRLQAHHAAWPTSVFLGQLPAAHNHLRDGMAIYDPAKHRDHALSYAGHDPGVCGYAFGALSLWLLGYPEQAMQKVQSGLKLAQELRHSPSLAFALCYGSAAINVACCEPERALSDSERL
jgi:predicted ATPase